MKSFFRDANWCFDASWGFNGLNDAKNIYLDLIEAGIACLNPFKPEFTIIIFIHYKPRIAVAILDL